MIVPSGLSAAFCPAATVSVTVLPSGRVTVHSTAPSNSRTSSRSPEKETQPQVPRMPTIMFEALISSVSLLSSGFSMLKNRLPRSSESFSFLPALSTPTALSSSNLASRFSSSESQL